VQGDRRDHDDRGDRGNILGYSATELWYVIRSPMPVGVMRSSAMTIPIKPIARPSLNPAKITAAA